jgi:lipopolysaccharide/colanic/teichoic acid biosynthesis glycosyltransferase
MQAITRLLVSRRRRRPTRSWKRMADCAIACALIAITLPLMAIVALAIKFDSVGPVLTQEERLLPGGRRIVVFNFRTMADRTQHGDGSARHDQPNRTRVGQFLCYIRIASLPQLLNVLQGEMSFVDAGIGRPDFFAD